LSNTDVKVVKFFGDVGNETLDGSATNTPLEANGGEGDDVLIFSPMQVIPSPQVPLPRRAPPESMPSIAPIASPTTKLGAIALLLALPLWG
jgi:hypothetical protein